jgi:ABC-type transport system involved in multi-copper enzyme maturation permease subunit
MKRLYNLAFVIGLFFLALGIILFIYGVLAPEVRTGKVNGYYGGLLVVFGIVMLLLSRYSEPGRRTK